MTATEVLMQAGFRRGATRGAWPQMLPTVEGLAQLTQPSTETVTVADPWAL